MLYTFKFHVEFHDQRDYKGIKFTHAYNIILCIYTRTRLDGGKSF